MLESYINSWISQRIIFDMKNQMYRQRQGIGSQIFADVCAAMATQGYDYLSISCEKENTEEICFWKAQGFKPSRIIGLLLASDCHYGQQFLDAKAHIRILLLFSPKHFEQH